MLNRQGELFRKFIENKGISDTEVGILMGVSSEQISNYYKSNKFQRPTLNKIQKVFTDFLLNNIEYPLKDSGNKYPENDQPSLVIEKKITAKIGSGIPMYNVPASASDIEMYQDENDVKIVGFLNMPGSTKNSFALPVHGHSMYPTLENGNWCVVRPISDPQDIEWGEIYFIQYGDYRVFKRIILGDTPDMVTLCSDNQSEAIMNKPKYAPKAIKLNRIKKLCIVTDILKKPNY